MRFCCWTRSGSWCCCARCGTGCGRRPRLCARCSLRPGCSLRARCGLFAGSGLRTSFLLRTLCHFTLWPWLWLSALDGRRAGFRRTCGSAACWFAAFDGSGTGFSRARWFAALLGGRGVAPFHCGRVAMLDCWCLALSGCRCTALFGRVGVLGHRRALLLGVLLFLTNGCGWLGDGAACGYRTG